MRDNVLGRAVGTKLPSAAVYRLGITLTATAPPGSGRSKAQRANASELCSKACAHTNFQQALAAGPLDRKGLKIQGILRMSIVQEEGEADPGVFTLPVRTAAES